MEHIKSHIQFEVATQIADYMGCSLNTELVEVYAAYHSNTYAVRVDEDTEFLINEEGEIEEVEFATWPPTETEL